MLCPGGGQHALGHIHHVMFLAGVGVERGAGSRDDLGRGPYIDRLDGPMVAPAYLHIYQPLCSIATPRQLEQHQLEHACIG